MAELPDLLRLSVFCFLSLVSRQCHGFVRMFEANKHLIANWAEAVSERCADHLKSSKSDWILEVI